MLLSIKNGTLQFNKIEIFKKINFVMQKKEKICLLGDNGSGKSTLLKIIKKKISLNSGSFLLKKNIKISYLTQTLPERTNETVYEFICKGIGKKHVLLLKYDDFLKKKKSENILYQENDNLLWQKHSEINKLIKILKLKKYATLNSLSGGWLRKVNLARTLINTADLLLLDEPTNHLDVFSIEWLEKYLLNFHGAILFTSHDRNFIDNITTKIFFLENKELTIWKIKNFDDFLKKKKNKNEIENKKLIKFEKKFKIEEIWSKKGIKARRTRNEGRLKKFKKLKIQNNISENNLEPLPLLINSLKKTNKIIFDIQNISFKRNEKYLIKNFSEKVIYGEKIALIGPNGCGKSSLLKILLKKISIKNGIIKKGQNIKISYLDQERKKIKKNNTILENISINQENFVLKNRTYNIFGLLKKFNFSVEKIYSSVNILSGGEINRLLLLKLFLKPSHVLILDEPTNDLDITTLLFLEKILKNYPGTIFLVSHDRFFLQNIAKKFWYFTDNGEIIKDVQYKTIKKKLEKKIKKKKYKKKIILSKFTYDLKKELEILPQKLEILEKEVQKIEKKVYTKKFYKQNKKEIQQILSILSIKKKKIQKKFLRWEFLEMLKNQK
ncbi:ATP-binding cassette domain-containing protein [Buchnera aphidicola]|uniref:ABC transporter ATP-binding protein uup n=1 Tax=Buchnera aphidicola subsp. Tuberolachnus salignus TaxID=98804 RepID=A0A160SXJ0_BUCTT|nr:ATP-binding cassette domain-containing protein [Buchnera aphidicola]CUR53215.1 ABC transporter ATP-binding protein uup [Buchnera aphidicola (Tuberolachnus salignus)]